MLFTCMPSKNINYNVNFSLTVEILFEKKIIIITLVKLEIDLIENKDNIDKTKKTTCPIKMMLCYFVTLSYYKTITQ